MVEVVPHAMSIEPCGPALEVRASCSCGWHSALVTGRDQIAIECWEIHRDSEAAGRSRARARERFERACSRTEHLRDIRDRARDRRRDVAAARQQLRRRAAHTRAASGGPDVPVTPHDVAAIRSAAAIARWSDLELWVRSCAVGMNAASADVERMLTGADAMTRHAYNALAVALNEFFEDDGLGRPLDLIGIGDASQHRAS